MRMIEIRIGSKRDAAHVTRVCDRINSTSLRDSLYKLVCRTGSPSGTLWYTVVALHPRDEVLNAALEGKLQFADLDAIDAPPIATEEIFVDLANVTHEYDIDHEINRRLNEWRDLNIKYHETHE